MTSSTYVLVQDRWRLAIVKKVLLVSLGALALISVAQGFLNAVGNSQDFQWSPAVLFLEGENPYQHFLAGNQDKSIILNQQPVYAHSQYIMLMPLATLSWDHAKIAWAAFNIGTSVFITVLVGRTFGLSGFRFWLVLMVFLASTPFRNGVGNGQQSTFTLLAFCVLLYPKTLASSFWAGFGYIKYSFAPPLAIYLFFLRGWKHLIVSGLPCFLGYIAFLVYMGGDPITVLLQPLETAAIASVGDLGTADIASVVSSGKTGPAFVFSYYMLPLALAIGVVLCICKIAKDERLRFALLCSTEMICFRHLLYDFIFLLPAFAYAVANPRYFGSKIIFLTIIFNWCGLKLINVAGYLFNFVENEQLLIWLNFGLTVATVVSLFSIARVTRRSGGSSRLTAWSKEECS